jgi:hypothetical protein
MRVDHDDRSDAGRLPDAVRTPWIRDFMALEREVFGDDNAHGTSMVTAVGPPGGR